MTGRRTNARDGATAGTRSIPNDLLDAVARRLRRLMGLEFPRDSEGGLERAIVRAALDLGEEDPGAFARRLLVADLDSPVLDRLIQHVTVGETYFFRDHKVFELLEKELLPDRAAVRDRTGGVLRLWSAGCSTGEEAYSLAIVARRALGERPPVPVRILGTDINRAFLERAREGVYRAWSLRDIPAWVMQDYLVPLGDGRYQVPGDLKSLVSFQRMNLLADGGAPPIDVRDVDVVLCRNVLIYLEPEARDRVVERLADALAPGGWLILSPTDVLTVGRDARLRSVRKHDTLLFQRTAQSLDPFPVPDAVDSPRPARDPGGKSETEPGATAPVHAAHRNSAQFSFEAIQAAADAGELERAARLCTLRLARDRRDPVCHYLHATILQEMGKVDEAIAALQTALDLDPSFALAHVVLGGLMRQQDRNRDANRCLTNALDTLEMMAPGAVLPHSGGLTAKELRDTVRALMNTGGTP